MTGGRPERGREEDIREGGEVTWDQGGRRLGWAGGENVGLLVGYVPDYRTACRRQGGRTDDNPFWDVQHPERTERQFGVGLKGYGTGQCGCWGVSREKFDGRNLHPGIRRVQGRRDAGAKPIPRQSCAVLPGLPQLFSRGDTSVRSEHHRMPAGDGGEALEHCQMLPGAGRWSDNLGRGGSDEKAIEGGLYCRKQ